MPNSCFFQELMFLPENNRICQAVSNHVKVFQRFIMYEVINRRESGKKAVATLVTSAHIVFF